MRVFYPGTDKALRPAMFQHKRRELRMRIGHDEIGQRRIIADRPL
jgi:hypothetical protein